MDHTLVGSKTHIDQDTVAVPPTAFGLPAAITITDSLNKK